MIKRIAVAYDYEAARDGFWLARRLRAWLITSLSPGVGAKMSKHSVAGGDVAGLLERFAELSRRRRPAPGTAFRLS